MERPLKDDMDVLAVLRGAIDPANDFHREALARIEDLLAEIDMLTECCSQPVVYGQGRLVLLSAGVLDNLMNSLVAIEGGRYDA